jgi:hypothetical protein
LETAGSKRFLILYIASSASPLRSREPNRVGSRVDGRGGGGGIGGDDIGLHLPLSALAPSTKARRCRSYPGIDDDGNPYP